MIEIHPTISKLYLRSMRAAVGKVIDAERRQYVNDDWGEYRYSTALTDEELKALEDLQTLLEELERQAV